MAIRAAVTIAVAINFEIVYPQRTLTHFTETRTAIFTAHYLQASLTKPPSPSLPQRLAINRDAYFLKLLNQLHCFFKRGLGQVIIVVVIADSNSPRLDVDDGLRECFQIEVQDWLN